MGGEWEAKPPEERVQGRLLYWIQKQRLKGGREPTEEEIAARRAALLAEVVESAGGSTARRRSDVTEGTAVADRPDVG